MGLSMTQICCLLFICSAVCAPAAEAAFTCGAVSKNLIQCLNYLKGTESAPSLGCCAGVTNLANMAKTTDDRKAACTCLKGTASSIKGINYANAGTLPKKCKVSVPYPISPSVDCSKVH